MIYLIGGPPRTGKSILANLLLEKNMVPYCSTDVLYHALKNSAPQLGIPDRIHMRDKNKIFFPFLEQFIKYTNYDPNPYAIEGDGFLPDTAQKLADKYKIRSIFLGFSVITLEQIMGNIGSNDWLKYRTLEEQQAVPAYIMEVSKLIAGECQKFNLKYIDMSGDFNSHLEEAYRYLTDF